MNDGETMENVNEQLASFDKSAEIAENLARLNWERAKAKALELENELALMEALELPEVLEKEMVLKIHSEAIKMPEYRENYIADVTPDVRVCNATGHYTPVDLAVLFDLSVKDITAILKGCG